MMLYARLRRSWIILGSMGTLLGCSGSRGDPGVSIGGAAGGAGAQSGVTTNASGGTSVGLGGSLAVGGSGMGGAVGGDTARGGSTNSSVTTGGTSTSPASGGGSSGGTSAGGAATGGSAIGGASAGGAATGGSAIGGAGSGGVESGGVGQGGKSAGGASSGGIATGGVTSCVTPSITKDAEAQIALSGYTAVSYGGYLNGESFQQDGIVTYKGYQYTAFWNTTRQVVLARRKLSTVATTADGAWEKFDFTDYTNTEADAHNTISLGVAPADGTLHVSFDHHSSTLHYRRSTSDILNNPASVTWAVSSFTTVTNALVAGTTVTQVTYPRFITEPSGTKMLFSARIGTSGSGDEHLWEYDTSGRVWSYLGKYLDGISASVNAYLHGVSYTRGGSRLHISWCWRATSDAATNFDLFYLYSDDHGRTWKNNAGTTVATTGTTAVTLSSSANAKVWTINQNRGLINQEHMAIDTAGRVHLLLSHMPDSQVDDSDFTNARKKTQYFHYLRNTDGTWARHSIASTPVMRNFRGKLAISSSQNVYAIVPTPSPSNSAQAAMRIVGASPCDNYDAWTVLATDSSRAYFSDPLIDTVRLESSNELTIYYPQQSSVNIWGLEYTLK